MASVGQGLLKEDVVEYHLYFDTAAEIKAGQDVVRILEDKRNQVLATLSRFCVNYIWQVEPFTLRVTCGTGTVPPHLSGVSCYGDNVEDEWFIVSLLFELSKELLDLVISIQDFDGQFLLIEAADHIPKWLNPDTAENRVFIHRGKLHVVPRSFSASSITECINYVRQNHTATVASDGVQGSLRRRMAGYPQKSQESLHRAQCYIPASLAAVLEHSPSLVAPIVQAFYLRDPIDLKACITFQHFRPGTRVMRQVLFTRCLYAQLLQQQFSPDRRSGYSLPPASNPKFKAHDLGMKLAHGAEILCSKFTMDDVDALETDSSLKSDSRWQRFLAALKSKGYFKGELEGSKQYKILYDDAAKYYKSAVAVQWKEGVDVGRRILSVIKSVKFDIEEMRQQEKNLPPSDDDSWINITPDQLDKLLNNNFGKSKSSATDMDEVAARMKSFVEKMSSHEGAEFPGDEDDVQLDSTGFIQTMQKIFEFDDPDSESSSGMDEYESEEELGDAFSSTKRTPHPKGNGKAAGSKPATKPKPTNSGSATKKDDDIGNFLGMRDYMDAMDRELAKTTIGKSFIRQGEKVNDDNGPKPPPRRRKPKTKTVTPNSTPTMQSGTGVRFKSDIDDEDDDFRPVDVDMNAVKNLLQSYESQHGLPGPASNILGGMGMRFPPPSSDKR